MQDSTLPAGSCDFSWHNQPRGISSILQRWTRPIKCDLIVKLFFSVAEPAQIDNSLYFHDLLCNFLWSNSCTFSYCCNNLGLQVREEWIIPTLSIILSKQLWTIESWFSLAKTQTAICLLLYWCFSIWSPHGDSNSDYQLERLAS